LRGRWTEGKGILEDLLARPGAVQRTAARARALNAAGILANNLGSGEHAVALLEESLAIRREAADNPGIAFALQTLGTIAHLRRYGSSDLRESRDQRSVNHRVGIANR
jgi:hypothetical protein